MNKVLFYIIFFSCFVLIPLSQASALEVVKNTYYFLKDDGKFSDEEKDEEAQYIYGKCERNVMQRTYYNCQCIAGAFRQKRDTDTSIRPQSNILQEIYDNTPEQCINKPGIAGENYTFCTRYAATFREKSLNNETYCTCVANGVADRFAKDPKLKTHHIQEIRTNMMVSCNKQYK